MKTQRPATQKLIALGTDWKAAKPVFWHAACNGPMRKKRGQYMLSAMRHIYEGFTFDNPNECCTHCGKPMVP